MTNFIFDWLDRKFWWLADMPKPVKIVAVIVLFTIGLPFLFLYSFYLVVRGK